MVVYKGNGLSFEDNRGKSTRDDRYITTCIRCRYGIFSNHEYEWSRGDGLVHINCDDPKLENAPD